VRAVDAPPADVQPHLRFGNAAQRVVQCVDPQGRIPPVGRDVHLAMDLPAVGQVGIVDLQQDAGVRNRHVLLTHCVGNGEEERLVRGVVLVPEPVLDGAGATAERNGWTSRPRQAATSVSISVRMSAWPV
jgi:hypothetical protein